MRILGMELIQIGRREPREGGVVTRSSVIGYRVILANVDTGLRARPVHLGVRRKKCSGGCGDFCLIKEARRNGSEGFMERGFVMTLTTYAKIVGISESLELNTLIEERSLYICRSSYSPYFLVT